MAASSRPIGTSTATWIAKYLKLLRSAFQKRALTTDWVKR